MASKNQVTLTFAGDSTQLEKSFDRVGKAAQDMGDESQRGFGKIGEGADTADTRAMGFRDTITGFQDLNRGLTGDFDSIGDQLFMIGMGFGDLASGVANFGVQFAQQVGGFVANHTRMLAVHMANAARMAVGWLIAMGPIALVIAAIAAIIGILALLGVDFEDFRNIASGAWNGIKAAASGVFNWLKSNWPLVLAILTGPFGLAVLAIAKHRDKIVGFFRDLPERFAGWFSGIGRAIVGGIKSVWNSTIGGFGFDVPSWIPGIGGRSFRIPKLHQGGIVPGAPGTETLALLQAGERVTRAGAAPGPTIVINVAGSIRSDRDLMKLIRDELSNGGLR